MLDPHDPHAPVTVPPGFTRRARQPLVAGLRALLVADRAPLVETPTTGRLIAARDSGPGTPAAPAGDRLRLLPSGPDLVRKPTPRGTRTIDAPSDGATGAETLGGEFSPARADCGYRAPLPPRLARSVIDPNAPPHRASSVRLPGRDLLQRPLHPPSLPRRHWPGDARRRSPGRRLRLERLEQHDHRRQREQSRRSAGESQRSPRRRLRRAPTTTAKTPTSGPLSKEPKVTPPVGRRRRARW